jgi:hypothetical protein
LTCFDSLVSCKNCSCLQLNSVFKSIQNNPYLN